MFGQMNKSADVMQVYVDQIKAAAIAGIDQDTAAVNRITRRIVRANRKIDRIGARMQTLADDFNLSSGECEK